MSSANYIIIPVSIFLSSLVFNSITDVHWWCGTANEETALCVMYDDLTKVYEASIHNCANEENPEIIENLVSFLVTYCPYLAICIKWQLSHLVN